MRGGFGRLVSRDARHLRLGALLQRRGRVLELAVFEELLHQLAPRVGLVLVGFPRVGGEEHPALDLHERRGHDEELPRELDVEFAHGLDVVEELVRDARDGDVEDVHLVPLDEVEEQVERAVEGIERDGVGHGDNRTDGQ